MDDETSTVEQDANSNESVEPIKTETEAPEEKVIQIKIPNIKAMSKNKKILLGGVVIVLLVVLAIVGFSCSGGLMGDDQRAYEAVLAASPNFKSPSSVKIVSGSFGEGEDNNTLYAVLTAENGFGAGVKNAYKITVYGSIDPSVFEIYSEEDMALAKKSTINSEKVNAALAKHFGN